MPGPGHWLYEIMSPIAILISAGGAWWFANKAIKNAADVARKKSTFDYLSKLSWDRDYIEAKSLFMRLKLGPKKLRAVAEEYERLKNNGTTTISADPADPVNETIREHTAIKSILNEYEALAIAIDKGALDADMMKANIQQQFVDHVDACKEFIEHSRKVKNFPRPNKIWCELQKLAEEWRKP